MQLLGHRAKNINKKSMPVTYFIMCAKYLNCTLDYLARDVQIGESTETKSA